MVTGCCIKSCPTKAGHGVMMHKFPTGELCVKWVEFVCSINPTFRQTKSAVVCGNHFTPNDYSLTITSIKGRKTLNKNAVPSIVNKSCLSSVVLPSNSEAQTTTNIQDIIVMPEKSPVHTPSSLNTSRVSIILTPVPSSPPPIKIIGKSKQKLLLADFHSSNDIDSLNNRSKYWDASQKVVKSQKKKIKLLTNQNNYLRNKIKTMTTLLKRLKEEDD